MDSIGKVLEEFFSQNKEFKNKLEKVSVASLWPNIVGDFIAKNTKPLAITDGILKVEVNNTVLQQELSYMKDAIKEKLNKTLKDTYVDEIKFLPPRSEIKKPYWGKKL